MTSSEEELAANRARKWLFKAYIRNCRRRNVFWGLSIEQFKALISQPCSYCGKMPSQPLRRCHAKYNGIDRKNNRQGYLPENCTTACKECNSIKGDKLTFEEMRVAMQAVVTFRKQKGR